MHRLIARRLILCLALVLLAPRAFGEAPATVPASLLPPGIKLLPNIEYANVKGKSLVLDLYLPEDSDKPVPVVVYVHGGGWVGGDRHEGLLATRILGKRYAVASIEYRFSNEAIFPAQIYDCKAAVRWVRAHAKFYNLDAAHIGAAGASAGGHLSALLGVSGDVKELEGDEGNVDQSSKVQAVCDWFGPTDFPNFSAHARAGEVPNVLHPDTPDSLLSRLFGGPASEKKELAVQASPITYVSKDSPPFLVLHGDRDALVPLAQSQEFVDALKKAGADAQLIVVEKAGHGFGSPKIDKAVLEFFDRTLYGKKPTGPAN